MSDINNRVKLISYDEMYWDWDNNYPTFVTKTPNSKYGGIHLKFDPFPCYNHNIELVESELARITNIFPIKFETHIFVFQYECHSRTNGQAYTNIIEYEDKEINKKSTWDGVIDLYGKRIPIMPNMTRYLISHEYGHLIDTWICNQKDLQYNGLDEDYAKMRKIENNQKYGGKKWHTNIGEIITNDLRIVLFNTEPEFWPHDCEHPLKCLEVIKFWNEMKEKYSYKNE